MATRIGSNNDTVIIVFIRIDSNNEDIIGLRQEVFLAEFILQIHTIVPRSVCIAWQRVVRFFFFFSLKSLQDRQAPKSEYS